MAKNPKGPKMHYREAGEDEKKAFSSFLSEDEELIVATGFGKTYMRTVFIMAMLWPGLIGLFLPLGLAYYFKYDMTMALIAGFVGMIVLALIKTIHVYHAHRYLLTTRRVIIKEGVFAVNVTSALYDKITHIEVHQSFWDKILMHYGTIKVNTAGMSTDQLILQFVDYPIELKNLLERLINRERERYGGRGSTTAVEGEVL